MRRRKAEAKAAGDNYMQLADFNRPRRRFFLGAWLTTIWQRLRPKGEFNLEIRLGPDKADQPSG